MPRRANTVEVVINGTGNAAEFIESIADELAIVGAVGGAALVGIATRAASAEKGLAEISTLLDGNVTPAINQMRAELLDMSVTFGQTIEKMTKARYDIISAGFTDAADSANVLTQANKLAAAGVVDVATAADLLTTGINGMGLAAEDAARVSDVLFQTVRSGKTTISELSQSFGKVFANAKVAGVSLEEVGAAMAAITSKGVKTAEASTALSQLLIGLGAPTKEAGRALSGLGITLDDGLLPALASLSKVSDQGIDQLRALIPEVSALKAAAAAGADIEGFVEILNRMHNAAGVTEEGYRKMAQTLDFQTQQVRAAFDALTIEVGTALMPKFKTLITRVRDVIQVARENKDAIFELTLQLFHWGVQVAKVALILITLQRVIQLARNITVFFRKDVLLLIGALGLLAIGIKTVGDDFARLDRWVAENIDLGEKFKQSVLEEAEFLELMHDALNGNAGALENLKQKFPILSKLLDVATVEVEDFTEEWEELRRQLTTGMPPVPILDTKTIRDSGDEVDGLRERYERLSEQSRYTIDDFINLGFVLGDTVAGALGDISDYLIGLRDDLDMGDIARRMASILIRSFIQLTAQIVVATIAAAVLEARLKRIAALQVATSFGGAGGIGGAVSSAFAIASFFPHGGQVARAAMGFVAPGTPGYDGTLVRVHGGERILTQRESASLFEATKEARPTSDQNLMKKIRAMDEERGSGVRARIEVGIMRPLRRSAQRELMDSFYDAFDRDQRATVRGTDRSL